MSAAVSVRGSALCGVSAACSIRGSRTCHIVSHRRVPTQWSIRARTETGEVLSEQNLESEVESFMKRQAEIESGAAFARSKDTDVIIGGDVVSEEMAKGYCRDIFEILKTLKKTRDMSVSEVKLVISIEDPRARERRLVMGLEDERGVARDEVAAALTEVAEGRVPKDRIALRCLHEEVTGWPFLERDAAAAEAGDRAASGAAAGASGQAESDYKALTGQRDTIAKPYIMGNDQRAGEKPKGLTDMLPDWVGFGTLYGISAIPVILASSVVLLLFFSSLR